MKCKMSMIKEYYVNNTSYLDYDEEFDGNLKNVVYEFVARYFTAAYEFLKFNIDGFKYSKEQVLDDLDDNESSLFKFEGIDQEKYLFLQWFYQSGQRKIYSLINQLDMDKLNDNIRIILEDYDFSLRNAIEDQNIDVLSDFLYKIPTSILEDMRKYGFIGDSQTAEDYTIYYVPNSESEKFSYTDHDGSYEYNNIYFVEPDYSQALVMFRYMWR